MASAQATGHPILDWSFNAGADMSPSSTSALMPGTGPQSTFQYTCVKVTTSDLEVAPTSSAGTPVVGILQNQPTLNSAATVRLLGISKCVVDGTTPIAAGDSLTTDSAGRGVKTTSVGVEIFAKALQASSAQNDIISVHVIPGQRY